MASSSLYIDHERIYNGYRECSHINNFIYNNPYYVTESYRHYSVPTVLPSCVCLAHLLLSRQPVIYVSAFDLSDVSGTHGSVYRRLFNDIICRVTHGHLVSQLTRDSLTSPVTAATAVMLAVLALPVVVPPGSATRECHPRW